MAVQSVDSNRSLDRNRNRNRPAAGWPRGLVATGRANSGASGASGPGAASLSRRRLPCPDCGKSYRWKDSLRRHQRVECGKEPQHCCPLCLYRFKHRFHLNAHLRDSCPGRVGAAMPATPKREHSL